MPEARPPTAAVTGTVAVVLKGYPRLSETFIAQELRGLECLGLGLRLYSLRRPTDPAVHPIHAEIEAPVTYLPEYLHEAPSRVLRAWRAVRRRPGYRATLAVWLRDLARDPTRNRVRRFGQALVLAHELPADVARLYAHFLHTPASVTRYAAGFLGLGWSCSAHAKDIWTIPDWEKAEKLADAEWVATCTAIGADHLRALALAPENVALVYHGLDLARFPPAPAAPSSRNGDDTDDPVTLLSVGRAVEKKGYDDLIDALARLPKALHWRLAHVGGGALSGTLKARAAAAGLADRIDWLGALPQDRLLGRYRAADIFVLACKVAPDGDRDGLPNALMEAQSQGLPCLSTHVGGVPELIEDGATGLLVPPGDPAALARALERLIREPVLRGRLGRAGRERVAAEFSFAAGLERLAARFGLEGVDPDQCASRSTRP